MNIGEKIQEHREKNRLSQEMLAEKLGVSRQSVSKWELSQALPEIDKIVAMSRLFEITTDELLISKEDICQSCPMLDNIKNLINENPKIVCQAVTNMLKGEENDKQKLAILMTALGADYAVKIYKHLTDDEIAIITMRVSMLSKGFISNIDVSTKNEALDEFYKMCTDILEQA